MLFLDILIYWLSGLIDKKRNGPSGYQAGNMGNDVFIPFEDRRTPLEEDAWVDKNEYYPDSDSYYDEF